MIDMQVVIRKVLAFAIFGIVGAIVLGLAAEWFIEVARDKGMFVSAGERWDRFVNVILGAMSTYVVIVPLSFLSGLVAGYGLRTFFEGRKHSSQHQGGALRVIENQPVALPFLSFHRDNLHVLPQQEGNILLRVLLSPPPEGMHGAMAFVHEVERQTENGKERLKTGGDLQLYLAHNAENATRPVDIYENTYVALIQLEKGRGYVKTPDIGYNNWKGELEGEPASFKLFIKVTRDGRKPIFATVLFVWSAENHWIMEVVENFHEK